MSSHGLIAYVFRGGSSPVVFTILCFLLCIALYLLRVVPDFRGRLDAIEGWRQFLVGSRSHMPDALSLRSELVDAALDAKLDRSNLSLLHKGILREREVWQLSRHGERVWLSRVCVLVLFVMMVRFWLSAPLLGYTDEALVGIDVVLGSIILGVSAWLNRMRWSSFFADQEAFQDWNLAVIGKCSEGPFGQMRECAESKELETGLSQTASLMDQLEWELDARSESERHRLQSLSELQPIWEFFVGLTVMTLGLLPIWQSLEGSWLRGLNS